MDAVYLAYSRLRRRKFDQAISTCDELLERQPNDQQAWWIKTVAMTQQRFVDDSDLEEEGIGEVLLDTNNGMTEAPRPGTSIQRPGTSSAGGSSKDKLGGINQGRRPMTNQGRPLTGFARPSTGSARKTPGSRASTALNRPTTSAAGSRGSNSRYTITSSGRYARLGTASMVTGVAGVHIDVNRLDLEKYAKRPALAKVLCEYLIHCEGAFRQVLQLAAHATVACEYKDWYWKARLGKCYYRLALYRDAEQQFQSAYRQQPMIMTALELGKVYLRLDQPNKALEVYKQSASKYPYDTHLLLGQARTHEMVDDLDACMEMYRKVIQLDPSSVEAISSLAATAFYEDQPEVGLRLYRRLLHMGVQGVEVWNNLGLSAFYASQYDLCVPCFQRALALCAESEDTNRSEQAMLAADVWYNVGHVGISIGDLGLAYQCFKLALTYDPTHSEAMNNLGVLELRRGNLDAARHSFSHSARISEDRQHEPLFNAGLLAYKTADLEKAYQWVDRCLKTYPDHSESKDLMKQLVQHFTS